jgi:hypothetical protein
MSINPVKNMFAAPLSTQRGLGTRKNDASFDGLLGAMRAQDGATRVAGGKAVAELLRIEMMRNSLSLADAGEIPTPRQNPLLAELLAECGAGGDTAQGTMPAAVSADKIHADGVQASGEPPAGVDFEGLNRTAYRFLGTPYRFGGEGPSGIDCSSFVQQVFRAHQVDLPRTAREQIRVGSDVTQSELRKGDLVFFRTYASYPSHVGIYVGDGKMIHASSARGKVVVSDMNTDYYRSRFLGAKRVA